MRARDFKFPMFFSEIKDGEIFATIYDNELRVKFPEGTRPDWRLCNSQSIETGMCSSIGPACQCRLATAEERATVNIRNVN